jgi:DNA-directed RNA polymerase-3 subunit RPC5
LNCGAGRVFLALSIFFLPNLQETHQHIFLTPPCRVSRIPLSIHSPSQLTRGSSPTATKAEDDPVIAEYNVFITPAIEEQIYLLQYPNRPRHHPYNSQHGATPQDMRIKPKSGFMEVDVKLNTQHNFNKYMALKWGDATRASREIHNSSGTYGPAAGLVGSKPRHLNRGAGLKDTATRELDLENDLRSFREAEQDQKVHATLTLGGQIIKHDGELEVGKPHYFVGAFQGDQLHLTKVNGTVQMRPNFHHLDAEEERARVASQRAQADAAATSGAQGEPVAHSLRQRLVEDSEKQTVEWKLKTVLQSAAQEQWIRMEYIDDEDQQAYDAFEEKLKVRDTANVPHLKSDMDDDAFLDAISLPRHDSTGRRRKRTSRRKGVTEVEGEGGDDDDDAEMEDVEAGG